MADKSLPFNDVTSNFTPEQRRQIFLKQAIAAGTGTTVTYKGNKYGVNEQEEIFLLNTGKLVTWPKTSPAYMEVLELANKKLGKTSTDSKNTQEEKEDTDSKKMSAETFKEEIKKIVNKKQQENFESEEAAETFMNSEPFQSALRIIKDPDIFNTVSQEELNRIISDLENC
tara:strand:- start:184 stop:696 length:513 start_codon:yes stop_codon:yes gene_type:complete